VAVWGRCWGGFRRFRPGFGRSRPALGLVSPEFGLLKRGAIGRLSSLGVISIHNASKLGSRAVFARNGDPS